MLARQSSPAPPGWPAAPLPRRARPGRSRSRRRARRSARRRGRGCATAPPGAPGARRPRPGRPTCARRRPRPPSRPAAGAGRRRRRRPRTRGSRTASATSLTGCTTPTSGLADWMATTAGSPWAAAAAATLSGETLPWASTSTVSKRPPRAACHEPACRTAECSTLEASSRSPCLALPASSPSTPRCTACVPLGVNVTSSGRTPRHSATTARALSSISRASRAGWCRRRGSAYPRSRARSRTSRAAGCSGCPEAWSRYVNCQRASLTGRNLPAPCAAYGDPSVVGFRMSAAGQMFHVSLRKGSSVSLEHPSRFRRAALGGLMVTALLILSGCSPEQEGEHQAPRHAGRFDQGSSDDARPVDVVVAGRHDHRRPRLGPDLLRGDPLPPPERGPRSRCRRATTCRSRSSTRSRRS